MRRDTQIIKTEKIPTNLVLHSALHNETYANGSRRYQGNQIDGGFCEVRGKKNIPILIKIPLKFIMRHHYDTHIIRRIRTSVLLPCRGDIL